MSITIKHLSLKGQSGGKIELSKKISSDGAGADTGVGTRAGEDTGAGGGVVSSVSSGLTDVTNPVRREGAGAGTRADTGAGAGSYSFVVNSASRARPPSGRGVSSRTGSSSGTGSPSGTVRLGPTVNPITISAITNLIATNNIINVIVNYSPILITFLIIFLSAFSQTWKGFFFFIILFLFCSIRTLIISTSFTDEDNRSQTCVKYMLPFAKYKKDGFNIFYITFLFGYIISPMILKIVPINIPLIVILGLYTIFVWGMTYTHDCVSGYYLFGNIIYSIISVSITISIILSAKWESLLFLYNSSDSVSDSVKCSMPSNQSFKCNVYKNGELISSNTS
jgi:hypothetical protein